MFMSPNFIYCPLINSYKLSHCHRLENLLADASSPEIGEKTLFIVGDFPPEFLSRGRARCPHRAAKGQSSATYPHLGLRAIALAYVDPFTRRRVKIRAPIEAFVREYGFELPKV